MTLQIAIALVLGVLVAGCDSTDCETCGGTPSGGTSTSTSTGQPTSSSTGTSCTQTTGMLTGAVTLFEPPGGPSSLSAPEALIELRRAPEDAPLNAMADDQGNYTVELPEGMWIVGGESADGYCTTFQPQTASIMPCETTTLDVVLEACVN